MNKMKKAIINIEMAIIHKLPDYSAGDKKGSKRKVKELMQKHKYDEDFIENINDDFCQGFDIAKRIIIKMCKNEIERYEKLEENFCLADKIRNMSDEELATFLTGKSDGYDYMKTMEKLKSTQNKGGEQIL